MSVSRHFLLQAPQCPWVLGSFGLLRHNKSPVKNVDFGLLTHKDSAVKNIRKCQLINSVEITQNSWQRKWECDSVGFHTHQFVSRVGTKLVCPDDRDTGVSYCRLLLGDTMLKDYSFRTGTSDSPICDCGIERETAYHFLLRCSRYSEARSVMKNYICELCFTDNKKRH